MGMYENKKNYFVVNYMHFGGNGACSLFES